ncbi:MAG: arylesterase [Gammaproteobacteria bacterium]
MSFSPLKLLFFLLLLQPPLAVHANDEPVLLVFGDSLSAAYGIDESEGWVELLQQRLDESGYPHRVVNASVSGETSTGGLARLPAVLENHEPDLVILELGGNDGLRGLPLNALRNNLIEMVEMSQESGARVLLTGIQIPPNYGPRYTVPFFELFGEVAREKGIALVPFLIDGIPQQPELMQRDGIHPRAEAQIMIVENVWPYLQPLLSAD